MKKILLFLVALFVATMTFAYEAQIDGIYYNFDHENKTATVTHDGEIWEDYETLNDAGYTQLDIVIPEKVTYNGVEYSVTSIGIDAFFHCDFFSFIMGNSVTTIESYAFNNCRLHSSITIPNSVTTIESYAFYWCTGTLSITIPNSVTSIGEEAFSGCNNLTSITIGNNVTSIGKLAFYANSSLDTLICEFGDDVELIYNNNDNYSQTTDHPLRSTKKLRYFEGPAKLVNTINEGHQTEFSNKLTEVHITDGELNENGFNYIDRSKETLHTIDLAGTTNKAISDLAFYDWYKLENFMLPSEVETIGFKAFAECANLKTIEIPASMIEIATEAFYNCYSISELTFAEGGALETIGAGAFYNNHALQSVEFPEGLKEVGDAAFYGCTYLDSLALPSTTQRIGDNCFALCRSMKAIAVDAIVPPTIYAKTFLDVSKNIPVIVPNGARDAYANDVYWGEFINVIESEENTSIENAENANVAIYSVGGVLYVDGLSADYQVFDVNGRLVYTGRDAQLSLPCGVYVVVVGDEVQKVVL